MTNQTPKRARLTWIIPVLLGIGTVIGCGALYRTFHHPIPIQIVEEARALSVDPAQLNDVSQLDKTLFDKKYISPAEWSRYESYATGSNLVFKRKLARHLNFTQGSVHEQRARSIMKQLLSDSDPNTRANALLSLRHFNDPSWREVAKQFLTDPEAPPRKMGTALLQKG